MISVEQAEACIHDAMPAAPAVALPLDRAGGEILREPIVADRPFPPFNRVAMDGIALAFDRWRDGARAFRVAGTQQAGEPALTLTDPAACIEVMTGAVLPAGTDCVVPVEELEPRDGTMRLRPGATLTRLRNVHVEGSDRAAGQTLIAPGTRLRAPQCAVAATVGLAMPRVSRRPRIALVSTGDELVPVETAPAPHQIRRSNLVAMGAALAAAGFHEMDLAHAPDERAALEAGLRERLRTADVLVLCGGVSAGKYDYVPEVLRALGVQERFHGVSQRPGKPMWFGCGGDGRVVFGLPGNPVSATVCLYRYVLPALRRSLGEAGAAVPRARLGERVTFKKALTLFLPVRLVYEGAACVAHPVPMNGSGDLAGLADSDGFLELPAGQAPFEAGGVYTVWRW